MTTIGVNGWMYLPGSPGLSRTKSIEPYNGCVCVWQAGNMLACIPVAWLHTRWQYTDIWKSVIQWFYIPRTDVNRHVIAHMDNSAVPEDFLMEISSVHVRGVRSFSLVANRPTLEQLVHSAILIYKLYNIQYTVLTNWSIMASNQISHLKINKAVVDSRFNSRCTTFCHFIHRAGSRYFGEVG